MNAYDLVAVAAVAVCVFVLTWAVIGISTSHRVNDGRASGEFPLASEIDSRPWLHVHGAATSAYLDAHVDEGEGARFVLASAGETEVGHVACGDSAEAPPTYRTDDLVVSHEVSVGRDSSTREVQ